MLRGGILAALVFFGLSLTAEEVVRIHLTTVTKFPFEISGLGLEVDYETPYKPAAIAPTRSLQFHLKKQSQQLLWQVNSKRFNTQVDMVGKPLSLSGKSLRLGSKVLPRNVFLYPVNQEKVHVVAEVDLESYLLGVMSSEMPASWPVETLKAQAVATRSYTLHSLYNTQKSAPFHLKTSVLDQVYSLSKKNALPPIYRAKILKAIQATKGQFLVDPAGKYLKAYYHSDCGGETEHAHHVWEGAKNMGVTKDLSCPQSPGGRWKHKISKKKLSQLVAGDSKKNEIKVISRTPSGRNHEIQFSGGQGLPVTITGQRLRELVGFFQIKSTNFGIQESKDFWVFTGRGNGHGVGLCQWGAKSLGKQKKGYLDMLKHYYPNADVARFKYDNSPAGKTQLSRRALEMISPSRL